MAIHVVVKMPVALRAYRERGWVKPLRENLEETGPDATMTRRGVLLFAGAGAATLLAANAGQSIGGPLRKSAFLAPRRAGSFPVNKTAAAAGIRPEMIAGYELVLRAGGTETAL